MKILIYSHFFPPETGAASVRMQYFVKVLNSLNTNIDIINPIPNYPSGKYLKGIKRFFYKNNNVTYLPIYVPKKDTVFKRMLSYISFFFTSLIFSFFKFKHPDIVFSSSPPIITALAAAIITKIKGSIFLLDIRDIWPDIGVELGITKNKVIIKGLLIIERFITNTAHKIIVTAYGDKQNLINKGVPKNKIDVIYNGADTKLFTPLRKNEKIKMRERFGLPTSKKILVYFGSLNQGMNDIETLLESLKKLKEINKECHFVLIGDGQNKNILIEGIKGFITFSYFSSLPISQLSAILSSCDLSLIPRKNIKNDTGGNIPVKCFESWAAGLPVILSTIEGSEIEQIVSKSGAGFVVLPGDPDIFAKTIINVLLRNDLEELGMKGHKFVEKYYDRYKQAVKLKKIIKIYEKSSL